MTRAAVLLSLLLTQAACQHFPGLSQRYGEPIECDRWGMCTGGNPPSTYETLEARRLERRQAVRDWENSRTPEQKAETARFLKKFNSDLARATNATRVKVTQPSGRTKTYLVED